MRPFYSEPLDYHKHSILTRNQFFPRKLRVFRTRISAGGPFKGFSPVDRTFKGDFPGLGREMVLALSDIERIGLGCFWDEPRKSSKEAVGRIRIDVAFHHVKGRIFNGVLRNPLGFLKALERTTVGENLRDLIDISSIQKNVRIDQRVRHSLIKATAEEWDPGGTTGEFPALVNYLEQIGFNILRP